MSRTGDRSSNQTRLLSIEINQLDRADGSGRFAFGSNAVLASVSGPLEVRLSKESPYRSTLEITHRPLSSMSCLPSRSFVTTLEHVLFPVLELEKFPRSMTQLVIQSLIPEPKREVYGQIHVEREEQRAWPASAIELDEYTLDQKKREALISPASGLTFVSKAAGINAATLALLSAGSIPMKGLPIAVAYCVSVQDELLLDPTEEEERKARARFGFGWVWGTGVASTHVKAGEMEVDNQTDGRDGELVWAEGEGSFSRTEWNEALESSKSASAQVLETIRSALGQYLATHQLA
ncbi:uncharacterized protein L203_104101 [Cryptococcus depauperatus CBS 7841]|uniref:Uncharacterized protein n=1 Tax=Cryptococcus depauperatus CBS 7841 TaxID=1295531 RepID=A0A1E3IDX3_9TREE|nr:hypothetical protein L203_04450 [Cryptococcus depauperatus CBS 7841]